MRTLNSVQECDNMIAGLKREKLYSHLVIAGFWILTIALIRFTWTRQEIYWNEMQVKTFLSQFQQNCTNAHNSITLFDDQVITCSEVIEWKNKDVSKMSDQLPKYNGVIDWILPCLMVCFMSIAPVISWRVFRKAIHIVKIQRDQLINRV